MTLPSHSILPDLPSGYPLRPFRGWLRIVVPEATVNLITNPSLETNTTGYTAYSGASISQSITQQRRGGLQPSGDDQWGGQSGRLLHDAN